MLYNSVVGGLGKDGRTFEVLGKIQLMLLLSNKSCRQLL